MIAIISHDAGGAEILSSYVRRNKGDYVYVLEGPAKKIFESKISGLALSSLDEALKSVSMVLTGTSWQSDLEFRAIQRAKERGIVSCAYIDHWVNYRERFFRNDNLTLPDEIWVGDEYAQNLAQEQFEAATIRMVPNPYFADILEELRRYQVSPRDEAGERILYVCEPISEHMKMQFGDERAMGYTEVEAIRFFFENIRLITENPSRIVFRPHPAETEEKYLWVLNASSLPVETRGGGALLKEIMDCDIVVGSQSMAMVVGLLAGKRVYSSIPHGGRPCALPHVEIVKLNEVLHHG